MPNSEAAGDAKTAVLACGSEIVMSDRPPLTTQLSMGELVADRFEVRALAGVGGMGAVYRAWDRQTSSMVALKLLLSHNADAERFVREARVLSELVHPNIVRHVAHGSCADETLYLAMEWLAGTDLARRLVQHGLTVSESVELVRRVAEAMGVAHARGIVHRDLNPRNLFLVQGDVRQIRVLDFGIATLGSLGTRLTVSGSAIGTPCYMAPEQAQGLNQITPRADVFALGCVLFECLTGRRAFAGRTLMEMLAKILVDDVPFVSSLGVRVPPEVDRLVASMLAKRADERPADGAQVADALSHFAGLDDARPERVFVSASITTGEQRVISVILAGDVRRFALAGEDPLEDLGRIVAPFGVRFEFLANGSAVTTVSGRGSATDRVVQAARSALAIRKRYPFLPLAVGTGRGVISGLWPAGQAIERASQFLKSVSEAGSPPESTGEQPIFIDEVTAGLLDARFEVRGDQRGLILRGLRDLQAPPQTLLGVPTLMVGRNRELLTLEATYEECQADSVARVILVTCPAGFGKSRLAQEFLRKLRVSERVPEIWQAQGDPLSAGSPFALLSQAIRRASGVLDGEHLGVSKQKLRARIARHVSEAELPRILEFVAELIGAPLSEDAGARRAAHLDAVLAGDQMLRAFEDWLDAECEHSPLLLVLEDLHWGDLPTIRFVDSALRRLTERPLMVLALARPELHETFPDLWSRRGLVEIRLAELGRKASEALTRQVLGVKAREDVIERLVARASGNALWLEELLRAEVEGHGEETSDTLMVLVQSRLEALDTDKRLVLRAASVFGQRFWRGGVEALVGGQVAGMEALLRSLEEREIVAPRNTVRFPGQREYEFRNALFRDAAYAALTNEDRELGHRLAASWLERAGESDALALAEHFERGGLPERAAEWYLRGTRQALEGGDLEGALAGAERGLLAGASREQKGRFHLLQAEACKWQGRNADCQRSALEAIECLSQGSVEWCAAVGEATAASGKLGDLDGCTPLSQKLLDAPLSSENTAALVIASSRTATQLVLAGAVELADRLLARVESILSSFTADASVMGWVYESRAVRAGTGRDPSARVQLARAAAEQFERAGDLRNVCLQKTSLGFACIETGANAEAEEALTQALAIGERLNLSNSLPIAKAHLGRALARRGELSHGRDLELSAVEAFDEQGNQRLGGMARCYLCQILVSLRDLEPAYRAAREAVFMLENIPAMRRSSLATLAQVQLARGNVNDAFAWSEAAVSGLGPTDDVNIGESLVRLVHAETLYAVGKTELAKGALSVAHNRLLERALHIEDPERRRAFLENLPENARTRELARNWDV